MAFKPNVTIIDQDPSPDETFKGDWIRVLDGEKKQHEFHKGDVMRPENGFAFGDSVIGGFDNQGNAILYRPYLYVSHTGSPLVGYETIARLTPSQLTYFWTKIDTGRTT